MATGRLLETLEGTKQHLTYRHVDARNLKKIFPFTCQTVVLWDGPLLLDVGRTISSTCLLPFPFAHIRLPPKLTLLPPARVIIHSRLTRPDVLSPRISRQ